MLLGNYSVLNKLPSLFLAGSTTSVEPQVRSTFNQSGTNRNFLYQDGSTTARTLTSIPSGQYTPNAYMYPEISGDMSSRSNIIGVGSTTLFNIAGGKNTSAPLTGSGDLTASLGLIVALVASLSGSGGLTANMNLVANIVAALNGSGDLTAAIRALAAAAAALSGSGNLTAIMNAYGSMSSDIVVTGDLLTTANVGSAVWDFVDAIESGLTPREAMRLLSSALAGKVSGGGSSTITFKNAVADTKNRIVATVDSNGNRTAITTDVT